MKDFLSTHDIYVKQVVLKENRKDFNIGYQFPVQGMNFIKCNYGFEYFMEFLINIRLDVTAARINHNLLCKPIQCTLFYYDNTPIGISLLESDKCFLFDRGEVLSQEEVKTITKTQKRQELYCELEKCKNKLQEVLNDLCELEIE